MRIVIFGKSYATDKKEEINALFSSLRKYAPQLLIDREFLRIMHDMGITEPGAAVLSGNDFEADIALSLGGDGTFLKTAERIGDKGIPILGINLGRMGFLADVQCSEMAQAIDEIMEGRYHIEERALLHVSDGSHAAWPYALNEVAVLKLDTSSMITIHAYLDGSFLNTYQADGLLVATPTGSTGYSLSVGGPIVAPNAANFIITPVAPHSLNVRPLVIGDNAEAQGPFPHTHHQTRQTPLYRHAAQETHVGGRFEKQRINASPPRPRLSTFASNSRETINLVLLTKQIIHYLPKKGKNDTNFTTFVIQAKIICMMNKRPNKRELAALLQAMIILSGNRPSCNKDKHNLIENVCKKYDFYPEILEITSVDPYEVFGNIEELETRLQFASYLISLADPGDDRYIEANHLSYLAKLLSILCR